MKIKFSSSEKLLLFSLAGATFTHIMDFMVLMPLGPQLMRVLDISAKEFGASFLLIPLVQVLPFWLVLFLLTDWTEKRPSYGPMRAFGWELLPVV